MNVRCALLASLIPLAASAAPKPPEPAHDPAAAAAQHAAPAPRAATRGSNLSAGDQVSIEIIEDKDAPVRKVVSDTGDLDVPYVGRVHVAGKSCAEAETQIKKLLEQEYYHRATVRVAIEQFSQRGTSTGPVMIAMSKVNLSGDVRAPGPQEFPKTEKVTISALVLKAGPTLYADLGKVRVTRRKGDATETLTVNVNHVLKEGKLNEDLEAHDGDYIHVPRRPIVF